MKFDYSMLKNRIREVFGSVTEFCENCGIDEAEFLEKVNNNKDFSSSEIVIVCDALHVDENEIQGFFFTEL